MTSEGEYLGWIGASAFCAGAFIMFLHHASVDSAPAAVPVVVAAPASPDPTPAYQEGTAHLVTSSVIGTASTDIDPNAYAARPELMPPPVPSGGAAYAPVPVPVYAERRVHASHEDRGGGEEREVPNDDERAEVPRQQLEPPAMPIGSVYVPRGRDRESHEERLIERLRPERIEQREQREGRAEAQHEEPEERGIHRSGTFGAVPAGGSLRGAHGGDRRTQR